MRVLLIIAGVIIFGTPLYYFLLAYIGLNGAIFAVGSLLAIAGFITTKRYFEHRRLGKHLANQPYRSTGNTRDWPQKYSKHRREQYRTTVNKHGKPRTSRSGRTIVRTLRFLHSVALRLITRSEMDKSLDNRLHRQTRWSDEIYP